MSAELGASAADRVEWLHRKDSLASGASVAELLEDYPQLTEDDIRAAIAYGAEMSRERDVDIKTGAGS